MMYHILHKNGNIAVVTQCSSNIKEVPEHPIYDSLLIYSEKEVTPYTNYIKNNELHEYTAEQTSNKIKFPIDLSSNVWDNDLMQYVDVRSLDTLREYKYQQLKQDYVVINNSNIKYLGIEYQADETSKDALFKQFQISLANPNYTVKWIVADNNVYELTTLNIKELVLMINERTQALKIKLQQLRTKIQTASKEELSELKLEI